MPKHTIEISHRTEALLAVEIDRANQANGTSLALAEWIELHLKEVAIARELAAAIEPMRAEHERQAQEGFTELIKKERERRLSFLDGRPQGAVDTPAGEGIE